MAHRFKGGLTKDKGNFNGTICCNESRLDQIMKRKIPTRWTIWNDLFHKSVPFELIDKVALSMALADQHTYQILTKRPEQALVYHNRWMNTSEGNNLFRSNVWLGVTAENQAMADERIPILLQIPAAVRFVSIEPLLEEIDLRTITMSTCKPRGKVSYDCLRGQAVGETGVIKDPDKMKELGEGLKSEAWDQMKLLEKALNLITYIKAISIVKRATGGKK